jgi:hypothetical protein
MYYLKFILFSERITGDILSKKNNCTGLSQPSTM